jgi:putative membrane protein
MIFVFLMTLFHLFLFFALKKFENNLNNYSERFYRIINEVPTLLLVIIIVLVVFQPEI